MIRMKLYNRRAARKSLEEFDLKGSRAINEGVELIAQEVVVRIVDSIENGPKSGRFYSRTNPARVVQASAPGEAPANDLGNLANSYDYFMQKVNQYAYSAVVGSPLAYAGELEYGDGNILPRPHVEPALDEVRSEVPFLLYEAWRRV